MVTVIQMVPLILILVLIILMADLGFNDQFDPAVETDGDRG